MSSNTVDNPFFARVWMFISTHEPEIVATWRRENLAGLAGRVLEVGAGTGSNFPLYPDTVTEVVAVEPERRLTEIARKAAVSASVPVTVTASTIESLDASEPFDAVVCSLVLCSVDEPDSVLRQLLSLLRPGGELRYLEHIASSGWRAKLQRMADATFWPRVAGNCHTHRHTERTIADAGFQIETARRDWQLPPWVPIPSTEVAIGRAVKPA
jgi:2-polyprenyl-3-methyl-5-hydroxy-6-metoxy-1,4-benzoquinol methylase